MPHISLKNVVVEFPIFDDTARSLRHVLLLNKIVPPKFPKVANVGGHLTQAKSGCRMVRALENVSLELREGDRLGLVGHNGSGKTTLLRVMSGIFEPVSGSVELEGRMLPMFAIGEGMAPDATGLEAVRMRGRLLGLNRQEIERLVEDVIDFCDMGEYIELPLRTYSTGMAVRLNFAIITSMRADILLMDELIGAGDAAFVAKAEQRLKDFAKHASILVVASHSPGIIRQWCSHAVLMEHGNITMRGSPDEVLARHQSASVQN